MRQRRSLRRVIKGRIFAFVAVFALGFAAVLSQLHAPQVRADAINTTDFVITVNTAKVGTSTATQFTIPTTGSGYNYKVDCNNDGVYEATAQTTNYTCNYASAGTYTIRIGGTFPRIFFNDSGDKLKITQINQWGTIAWTNMFRAFFGCSNLDILATDTPNLAGVTNVKQMLQGATSLVGAGANWAWNTSTITNMAMMFQGATAFNKNISTWNTGLVTDMSYMFYNATAFNQNISTWNTGLVTNMQLMFYSAIAFNQPIGTWNTASVTNMSSMFHTATTFNQDIGAWNTANVTTMESMFNSAAAFNQNIGSWNTGAVTSLGLMFINATNFNNGGSASIGNWNTGLVTSLQGTFHGADAFNQPIGTWDTGKVTIMNDVFSATKLFNQNIGSWNTAKVTIMNNMFYGAKSFNQNIGAWDTTNVTTMSAMFSGASVFNNAGSASIGSWNTGKVTTISNMFTSAVAFNQDLSTWNMSNVTAAVSFLQSATSYSTLNYDKLLISLDAQTLKPSVVFGTNAPIKYCLGSTARASIISGDAWNITDGGLGCATYQPVAMSIPAATITENNTPPQTIGGFTTTDSVPNTIDTYTYSLTCTTPGAQDGMFSIVSGQLTLTSTTNYEATPTLHVCVRVTNMVGQTYDKLFSLPVNNLFTLSYNGNSNTTGTAPAASETYTTGNTPAVAGNTGSLARTGYTFAGWNTAANGSGTSYAPGDSLLIGGDVTLYAVWNDTPPTLTMTPVTKLSNVPITDTTIKVTDGAGIASVVVDPTSTATAGSIVCTPGLPYINPSPATVSQVQTDCTIVISGSGDLVIAVTDTGGNVVKKTVTNYIVDTVVPSVPNVQVDTSTGINSPTVTFSAIDNIAIDHYEITYTDASGNPVTLNPATSPVQLFLDPNELTTGPDFAHTIVVKAYDTAGNVSTTTVKFPPIVNFTTPTTVSNATINNATVTITSPAGNPLDQIQLLPGTTGASLGACTGASGDTTSPYNNPVTCLINGVSATGTITVEARDSVTTAIGQNMTSFVIDTTAPVISITAPTKLSNAAITTTTISITDNYGIDAASVAITAANTTAGFAISSATCVQTTASRVDCTLQINGTQGTGDLKVDVTDQAGNTASQTEVGYIIDTTPPTVTVNQAAGQADPTNVNSAVFTVVFSEVATGFTASDIMLTGTTGVVTSLTTADNKTFTVTVSGLTDGDIVKATISATAATDPAGNANTASTSTDNTVTYDATPPTGTVSVSPATTSTSPAIGGTVNDPTAVITVVVDGTTYTATNNGDGTWSLPAGTIAPALGDGSHSVSATFLDAAGNSSTASGSLIVDTTPPTGTLATTKTSDTTPALTGTVNDPAAVVTVTINGTTYTATNNGDGTWSLPDNTISPALTEKDYAISVVFTDAAGNSSSTPSTLKLPVTVDPPALTKLATITNLATNEVEWTITATNPNDSAQSITIYDMLPNASKFVAGSVTCTVTSSDSTINTCDFNASFDPTNLDVTATLAAGETLTVLVKTTTAIGTPTITNTATASFTNDTGAAASSAATAPLSAQVPQDDLSSTGENIVLIAAAAAITTVSSVFVLRLYTVKFR